MNATQYRRLLGSALARSGGDGGKFQREELVPDADGARTDRKRDVGSETNESGVMRVRCGGGYQVIRKRIGGG